MKTRIVSNWIKCLIFRLRLFGKSSHTLYIIGNGFDIHHGLDTWYSYFGLFLQNNHPAIYDSLIKYIGMPELDSENEDTLYTQEWNEFEVSIANLFYDEIMDEHREYAASPASDDYHKDLGAIENYVSEIRDNLTIHLFEAFKEFINQVEYPILDPNKTLQIKSKARFFNFNYTSSLQEYYSISNNNILYIHNNANSNATLVLGHGLNPESFIPEEPQMPFGLDQEQKQHWIDDQADMFDISVEFGRSALLKYFSQSYKDTAAIIQENETYFNSLYNIEQIIIFGHSLASVDEGYINKIQTSVSSSCKWFIFYRNDSEIEDKKERLKKIGVEAMRIYPFHVNWLRKKCKS